MVITVVRAGLNSAVCFGYVRSSSSEKSSLSQTQITFQNTMCYSTLACWQLHRCCGIQMGQECMSCSSYKQVSGIYKTYKKKPCNSSFRWTAKYCDNYFIWSMFKLLYRAALCITSCSVHHRDNFSLMIYTLFSNIGVILQYFFHCVSSKCCQFKPLKEVVCRVFIIGFSCFQQYPLQQWEKVGHCSNFLSRTFLTTT